MELQLTGKNVVITGGTKGIGLAIVRGFLQEGARVHIIARNADDALLAELKSGYSSPCFFYPCDVTAEADLAQVIESIKKNAVGGIDIFIANVGSGKSNFSPVSDTAHWNTVWDINFNSALHCARIAAPELVKTKGVLLFISSIAGIEFIGAPTDYTTAKAALLGLAKSLSYRLAPDVRVNVIAPGNIYSADGTWGEKMRNDPEKVQNMLDQKVPLRRFGLPEEVSDLAVFLASPKAAFITGGCYVIDGGQTISF